MDCVVIALYCVGWPPSKQKLILRLLFWWFGNVELMFIWSFWIIVIALLVTKFLFFLVFFFLCVGMCKGLSETLTGVLYVLLTWPCSWSYCFFLVWFEVLFPVVGSGSNARFRESNGTVVPVGLGAWKKKLKKKLRMREWYLEEEEGDQLGLGELAQSLKPIHSPK